MTQNGHQSLWQTLAMAPTIDPTALLSTALRSRAASVSELAALAVHDEPTVREALAQLQAEGFLSVDGDDISYRTPENAVADRVRREADNLQRRIDELAALVGRLPSLVRDRDFGEAGNPTFETEVFHGPEAVVDLWHRRQSREPSRRTDVVLPSAARLYQADPEMQRVWHEASSAQGAGARVIGSVEDVGNPIMATRIAQELAGGVQLRMIADPPSWFWITDDTTVAVPLDWGEAWPTTVMAITSPSIAGMARWIFDRLWDQALPIGAQESGWDPVLRLMSTGATMQQASTALGISHRTGRRRLAEAMSHFGVGSMFALGAAWERQKV